LIKIFIVNFHYDLVMPNWLCRAAILQNKEEYMNMYEHILYIIIYWSPRLLQFLCFFFRFLFFET